MSTFNGKICHPEYFFLIEILIFSVLLNRISRQMLIIASGFQAGSIGIGK